MPHDRYFTERPLTKGGTLPLEDTEFHHLTRVMRKTVGDEVELVNGKGILAHAMIQSVDKHQALLTITEITLAHKKRRHVILAQAMPRLSKLEFILEKGTELGADAFWLFPGMLSEKDEIKPSQEKRLMSHLIGAMKQCGRLDLPSIVLKPLLKQWEIPQGTLFYGDPESSVPFIGENETGPIIFFVGPEKGFHPDEMEILDKKFNARGVRLHENTLRVETASLVALAKISPS